MTWAIGEEEDQVGMKIVRRIGCSRRSCWKAVWRHGKESFVPVEKGKIGWKMWPEVCCQIERRSV